MYVYNWITLLLKLIQHCKSTILQSKLKTGINPDIYQDSGQYITKPFILPPCRSIQNPSSYSLITFIYQDLSRFQTMHYKAFHLSSHASLSKTPLHINCSLFCRNSVFLSLLAWRTFQGCLSLFMLQCYSQEFNTFFASFQLSLC